MSSVCPKCGCPFSRITSKSGPQDKVNEFGNREISFIVYHEDLVHYNPATNLYDCKSCGKSFTSKEFTLQKIEPKIKQQRL
jgi:hypothetical protein